MRTSGKNKRKREPAAPVADELAAPAPAETAEAVPVPAEAQAASDSDGPVVSLASHSSVKDAQAFKSALAAHLDESACVTLDVQSLERIDTASMQLLCAFVRDRQAAKLGIAWRGDSQPLKDAARLLGVSEMLALQVADTNENKGPRA